VTDDSSSGPLDLATLEVLARRGNTHPLVEGWEFQPDSMSPRRLELRLDDDQYPPSVEAARIDVRWFEGGDYAVHYVETRDSNTWQCRWDRHPKPEEQEAHVHPPPDASPDVEPSGLGATHHLGVLFAVLDWIEERLERIHG
jgi:hypothetical protein